MVEYAARDNCAVEVAMVNLLLLYISINLDERGWPVLLIIFCGCYILFFLYLCLFLIFCMYCYYVYCICCCSKFCSYSFCVVAN